jgi:kinetochore protein NDC80
MEKELQKMRLGLGETVALMEQREMGVNLEYEEMWFRAGKVREELHTELERSLRLVVEFKIHVQGALEGFEEFVAQELEVEFEEGREDAEAIERGDGEVFDADGDISMEE